MCSNKPTANFMTTFPFHTTVLDNGMLAVPLPEEFRGKTVNVLTDEEEKLLRIIRANEDVRRKKTLDEIIAEQGGPRVCTNPESLGEDMPKLWNTEAELEEFLEHRKY
jgi:hypothetical protein